MWKSVRGDVITSSPKINWAPTVRSLEDQWKKIYYLYSVAEFKASLCILSSVSYITPAIDLDTEHEYHMVRTD